MGSFHVLYMVACLCLGAGVGAREKFNIFSFVAGLCLGVFSMIQLIKPDLQIPFLATCVFLLLLMLMILEFTIKRSNVENVAIFILFIFLINCFFFY